MSTYQGPNVSVTQKFELTPPAVAIEDLPSVVVGTAYDVYEKESLGMAPGLTSSTGSAGITSLLEFGAEKVVFDHTVVGKRGFDFYPPKAYVRTEVEDFEIESEDIEFTEKGIILDVSDTYPLRTVEEGSSEAFVPFYSAAAASIVSSDLQTVLITSGTVVTAKIQKGQNVFVNAVLVGVVGTTPSTEDRIKLAAPYTAAINGALIVGAATAALNLPDCFFDPNADFNADRVQIGDILEMNTNDLGEEILASIVSVVNKNTLRLQTDAVDTNDILKIHSMDAAVSTLDATFNVGSYKITRLISFSKMIYEAATGRPIASKVDATKFKVAQAGMATVPAVGDWFTISPTTAQVGAHTNFYKITSVFLETTVNYVIGTDQDIYLDGKTTIFVAGASERFNMWQSEVENEIICDFRAVRDSEVGVVKRITSESDITTAWANAESIDVHNELAWMAATTRAATGGRVLYGVNVDASDADLAGQYAAAFEALKIYNVYSHAIGTTEPGVNAIVAAYLEQQSEPYQGHERIATLCYDQDDIYLQGTDTGDMNTAGLITLAETGFDPIASGVTAGDDVDIFDDDGVFVETVSVVSTPNPLEPAKVQTDYSGDALSGYTFKCKSGRPADQAIKIGAIKYGNRRVKTIWPGYFNAYVGDTQMLLPPYYITANIVGRDGSIIVSQSFTNWSFTPYGLSNITLGTNFHFKKDELDTIGAGGIDIMIQDASTSQTIKSRHDLTSNMDAIEFREHSITKQADVSAKTYRSAIAPYTGKYNITDDLLRFVGMICNIVSQKLVKTPGIVAGAEVTSIKRDEVIADKINIFIKITVFVAGNYYEVELLVKSR